MKRTRHSAEQIVKKLYEATTALAGEKGVDEVCKALGISLSAAHQSLEKEYGVTAEEKW